MKIWTRNSNFLFNLTFYKITILILVLKHLRKLKVNIKTFKIINIFVNVSNLGLQTKRSLDIHVVHYDG